MDAERGTADEDTQRENSIKGGGCWGRVMFGGGGHIIKSRETEGLG